MSHSDYTRNILNIKDKNIIFYENCLEEVKIKNKIIKVFHAKLTYTPDICPNCGCIYESNPDTIIKYGFKKNCKIKMDKISNYTVILVWINKDSFVSIVSPLLLRLLMLLTFTNKSLIILNNYYFRTYE